MVTDHSRLSASDGRSAYLAAWSELHGGYDVHGSRMVLGWLTLAHALAAPLARLRVAPSALTAVGVVLALLASITSMRGGSALVVAAALLVASALVDSLDGAVAVIRGRSSAFGYVVDSVADRVSDLVAFAILWVLGAPPVVVLAIAGLTVLQETGRARAISAGMSDIEIVTVWERPSRIITVVITLIGSAFVADTATFATIGALIGCGLAALGFAQLSVTIFRRLRSLPAPRGDHTRG